uniref:uncharacterized protein LOC100176800 isoform X3 n=1 Tax=Ciona intestinalis TaxID=7719 RepID=UPI000180CAA1|nr:uncharacterized protein LOC100176800 isoform X3 [Ciona intestinalis]|eukprot:XP_026696604.1 uncharacterized protein LOC100176800 isoform X3 [Ciona intestinalis]
MQQLSVGWGILISFIAGVMVFSWYLQTGFHICVPVGKIVFSSKSLDAHLECSNVLENLTSGRWVVSLQSTEEKVQEYERHLLQYWRKRGIQTERSRKDGKCGIKNLQLKPVNSTWPDVGAWCDLYGSKPCCSEREDGVCSAPSDRTCKCRNCIDTRQFHFAELSNWKTKDPRCRWTNHSAEEACTVVERSLYDDVYFVGDSFMRNMFTTFILLVSNDPYSGAWSKNSTTTSRKLCHGQGMYFWKECRQMLETMSRKLHPNQLCGGRYPNFNVTMKPFYNQKFSRRFYDLVNGLLGRKGSLVIVGVGYHMQCDAKITIHDYINPAVQLIQRSNQPNDDKWPKLIFALPMLTGLLKPPAYLRLQNDEKIHRFAKQMKNYCSRYNIPVLDFRQLSKFVHSFDGTHYGVAVNLMKNQVLLNYINSVSG